MLSQYCPCQIYKQTASVSQSKNYSIFKRAHSAIRMFVVVVVVIGLLLQCENNHSNNYFKHFSDWLVFVQYYVYNV